VRFGEEDAQAKRDDVGKRLAPDERAIAQQRAMSWQIGQPLPWVRGFGLGCVHWMCARMCATVK
jgi:hypothetical protein